MDGRTSSLLLLFLRRMRRIADLKMQLHVVADCERILKEHGSINSKSLQDMGRKEEYENEPKRLEDMEIKMSSL